jgi:hypothetical protein
MRNSYASYCLRALMLAVASLIACGAAVMAGVAASPSLAAGGCAFPTLSKPFQSFQDSNDYFLAPGGDFETGVGGWAVSGGSGVVAGSESFGVGSQSDASSLALPVKGSAVTSPWICVTSAAPTFRMFIKNNGNKGYMDGQLAVYLNFTGGSGNVQQVKIAALTSKTAGWRLTKPISFIQYISTPLKSGYANISFTIKPNDDHGNWQLDDFYVDPYKSG